MPCTLNDTLHSPEIGSASFAGLSCRAVAETINALAIIASVTKLTIIRRLIVVFLLLIFDFSKSTTIDTRGLHQKARHSSLMDNDRDFVRNFDSCESRK